MDVSVLLYIQREREPNNDMVTTVHQSEQAVYIQSIHQVMEPLAE